ncbi:multidrug resistance-associated protein 4-like [Dendronephthya gigantea]|uniref:multidrug resistance-associated protein 4-like n=1 Tax=Dendronephthya gigantea TaxID=151771 RepID=UPI00106DBE2A|nr:multidrug resistance-associated protein 4-like [Dendronephthya gigantea]
MGKRNGHLLENPAANANIYSANVSQSWMNGTLKKGSKQPLEESDIRDVLKRDSTLHLATKLQRAWDHEVKTSKNPRLWVPLIKVAGVKYFFSLVYIVIEMAARTAQSIFIGQIVAAFYVDGVDRKNGYLAAGLLTACTFTEALAHHPLFLESLRTGMDVRVALSALVYNKALRMSQASLGYTDTGQIVNLVTNDVQKTEEAILFALFLFAAPALLIVVSYLCWREIEFAFLVGMGVLLFLPALQSWLGRFFASLRAKTAILRDRRIKLMNEVICGMRVIKMYAWERPFSMLVSKIRREEILKVRNTLRLNAVNAMFYLTTIPLVSAAMFIPYVLTGHTLTSEKVFTVIAIISTVNVVTSVFVPKGITGLSESSVSFRRIQKFLLLDEGLTLSVNKVEGVPPSVSVEKVHSSWTKESTEETLSDVSFEVISGELLMVIGPVGCGKSSLLMALLRELPITSGSVRISGRVAYVSQQPWVFSGTLKENILFGRTFDKTKYEEVVHVCALETDIAALSEKDNTLVGERGVSLSGGQRARVNLARAIYMDADVYLMDDPLSAVDAHVSRHIFSKCIRGILKSKVCILVTHQLQFLNEADRILCLQKGAVVGYNNLEKLKEEGIDILSMIRVDDEEEEGRSFSLESFKNHDHQVTFKQKLKRNASHSPGTNRKNKHKSLHDFGAKDPLLSINGGETLSRTQSAHDLGAFSPDLVHHGRIRAATSVYDLELNDIEDVLSVVDEKENTENRITGGIKFNLYKDYFLAGAKPFAILLCFIIFFSGQVSLIISEWWLAQWSDWEETTVNSNNSDTIIEEERTKNITVYVATVISVFIVSFLRAAFWFQILSSASRHLHDKMFDAILKAPIYFFDTNPVGRVLNRFSKDIGLMDDMLPLAFFDAIQLAVYAFAILLISIISQPYIAVVVVPIIGVFVWLRQYFVKSSREIKRIEALSRSPLYSHISATLQGLATIRASEEQQQFAEMYNKYQDRNTSGSYYYLAANRWLGYRLDLICASFMTFVAFIPFIAYEVGIGVNPVLVGLSLIYTKRLTGMFQFCVRQTAEVENQMVSVERVQQYSKLDHEADLEILDSKPQETWPERGQITGENVSFRYHPSLPLVLKGINFNIKPKEKVGIVGRTGAGKSSLISALFRLAEPRGKIYIDGVSIKGIGLHDLRKKLSIIPQDPVIFTGSVRDNLDPFSNHKDVEIWNALEQVQLKEVVNNYSAKLNFQITESGNNLSVGQRQLICLARAILKHNRILIIDEATANVDHKTDELIQETIRDKFRDCTVLTIAHRLNTIMDADRIMVLDAGRIVEFDEPYELLKRPDSAFSLMVTQTGKDSSLQLQRMAKNAHDNRANQ